MTAPATAMSNDRSSRLQALADSIADEFNSTRRIMSFDEWFEQLCTEPRVHLRNAAQYTKDALDHFGTRTVRTPRGPTKRYKLFDRPFDDGHRLVGQEDPQNQLYEAIDGYCRLGHVDSLMLLHGPNGSAKSTLVDCLQAGVEAYSRTERGCLYRLAWVFPSKEVQSGSIGFGHRGLRDALGTESYANLDSDRLDARLVDENKDHPIFLIPPEQRKRLIRGICPDTDDFVLSRTILEGDLSARNRRIFDALLNGYQGDYAKVLQHIQIERFFISRNYRCGLVDVEPKQTVDARSFPVTGDRAFAHLPPSVAGQVLYGTQGDLVEANRGIINFSDLLKRPYEHYKYLLSATETGRVALEQIVLQLDQIFIGSANDINLLEIRATRPTEYQSFQARLTMLPVPYLLDYRVERKIYQEQVGDLLRGVHIAPHLPRILALWGVMTRLRRPDPDSYDEKLRKVIRRMTPIEKADLYAYGRLPKGLSATEARELLAAVPDMRGETFEYAVVRAEGREQPLGDYEGSFGASVRDLKGVLLAAASEPDTTCVTVPKLFDELRSFMTDRVNYHWMHLEPAGSGFHLLQDDSGNSITAAVWERWLDLSDSEVRDALGLVDEARYLELFKKYVHHAKHFVKKERIFDSVTGKSTDADARFMESMEAAMTPNGGEELRADVLGRIGAWALTHPADQDPNYAEIFPDYFARMREDYYRQQKGVVSASIQCMLDFLRDTEDESTEELSADARKKARVAIDILMGKAKESAAKGEFHTKTSLIETLVYLAKHRY